MHVTTRSAMDQRGLGDLLDDFQQAARIVQETAQGQSIGGWIQTRTARLNALPRDVQSLRAKIIALQQYFSRGTSPVVPYAQLSEAERLLDDIDANLPVVQQRVTQLWMALSPVLPKLQAGTLDAEVLSYLASTGIDIVGTFHDINAMTGDYDQAARLVQQGVTDPAIPATVRTGAQNVMQTAGNPDWLKWGVGLGIGYLVIKAVT